MGNLHTGQVLLLKTGHGMFLTCPLKDLEALCSEQILAAIDDQIMGLQWKLRTGQVLLQKACPWGRADCQGSEQILAAIDDQIMAHEVIGAAGSQEDHASLEVVHIAQASCRDAGYPALHQGLQLLALLDQVGLHNAWGDRVDIDAARTPLHSKALHCRTGG